MFLYFAYFSVSSSEDLCFPGSKTKGVSAKLLLYTFEFNIQVTG